jgi:hypothetical protein
MRARPRVLAGWPREDRQLVAQQEVLRDQVAAIADGRTDQAEQQKQVLEHRPA